MPVTSEGPESRGVAGERVNVNGWRDEAEDLVRGMTGGLLVGVPLAFTMETWTLGAIMRPRTVLALLALTFALNLGCIIWAGFRREEGGGWRNLTDAVEATAIALVTATILLLILAIIQPGDPVQAMIGQVAIVALPISLGIAIANHLVGRDAALAEEDHARTARSGGLRATLVELGAAGAGAMFFGANIAPTDEIPLLAAAVPPLMLPVVVLFSLVVSYGIVFVADFTGQDARRGARGIFQHPTTETLVAYFMALVISVGMLWAFGRLSPDSQPGEVYRLAVILGLPAVIGGAAGRLAV